MKAVTREIKVLTKSWYQAVVPITNLGEHKGVFRENVKRWEKKGFRQFITGDLGRALAGPSALLYFFSRLWTKLSSFSASVLHFHYALAVGAAPQFLE